MPDLCADDGSRNERAQTTLRTPARGVQTACSRSARWRGRAASASPTLRTWEQRYGYPVARRKPSGHRVYPVASVERLRRISKALAQGHRAREVITASDAGLQALLGTGVAAPPLAASRTIAAGTDTASLLAHVRTLDASALTRALASEWGRLGPLAFLEERVAPLVLAVGEAWATRRIGIRHEHFFSSSSATCCGRCASRSRNVRAGRSSCSAP